MVDIFLRDIPSQNILKFGLDTEINSSFDQKIENVIHKKLLLKDIFIVVKEPEALSEKQQVMIKSVVELNSHVHFIFITYSIHKIIEELRNISVTFKMSQVPYKTLYKYCKKICNQNDIKISEKEFRRLSYYLKNNIRSILNYLQFIQYIDKDSFPCLVWKNLEVIETSFNLLMEKQVLKSLELIQEQLDLHYPATDLLDILTFVIDQTEMDNLLKV